MLAWVDKQTVGTVASSGREIHALCKGDGTEYISLIRTFLTLCINPRGLNINQTSSLFVAVDFIPVAWVGTGSVTTRS